MHQTSSRAPEALRSNLHRAATLTFIVFFFAVASPAQTFTSLASFDAANGSSPEAAMVQAVDGNLYGTTMLGGTQDAGVIFKLTLDGDVFLQKSLCNLKSCPSGDTPLSSLVLARSGALFGTTQRGGTNDAGTVFKITTGGSFHTLANFCAFPSCTEGEYPLAGLVEGADGAFYGTTWRGGALGYGEVVKVTTAGQLTTLYSFCQANNCFDGANPTAPMIQTADGKFYGTTFYGGGGDGTIFTITTDGTLTTTHYFNYTDGSEPGSKLLQGLKGDLYGTTFDGGVNQHGTIYKITTDGTLSTLYSFCSQANCADGSAPFAELIQASDGNLYGVTKAGGSGDFGTVFQITVDGVLTTLHTFDGTDGSLPTGGLVQATDGNLYGTTQDGGLNLCDGTSHCGTAFRISLGLAPFVKTLTPWGKAGWSVVIYGTGLSGATQVTFNGKPAIFTVVSATEIHAIVPAAAASGKIQVVVPGGALSTLTEFHVRS